MGSTEYESNSLAQSVIVTQHRDDGQMHCLDPFALTPEPGDHRGGHLEHGLYDRRDRPASTGDRTLNEQDTARLFLDSSVILGITDRFPNGSARGGRVCACLCWSCESLCLLDL